MSNIRSIGQIANYKPVSQLNMEELAAAEAIAKRPSAGVLFARAGNREMKERARERVLALFTKDQWPGSLHILTMPGLEWRFERLLLARREPGWMRRAKPHGTWCTSVENDRSIYYAAAAQMPGLDTPDALVKPSRLPFAESGIKTRYASFFFANINDWMAHTGWSSKWHAAWLDYTGQLTLPKMRLIARFYQRWISDILIVTALRGRWHRETADDIRRAGDYSRWLRHYLPGKVLHDIEYSDDGAPMTQFAVRHNSPLWFWQAR